MERKKLQEFTAVERDKYNRAAKSSASMDLNSAILLIKDIVKAHPDMGQARERLRELEKRKLFSIGFAGKAIAQMVAFFKVILIQSKMKSNPIAAMGMCEDALVSCLDNPVILNALADAANAADATFIEVEALQLIYEMHSNNEANIRRLVNALQRFNRANDAVKLFQQIASKYPDNINVQSELRAAMALASMERGKWQDETSSQKKSVDLEGAVTQQILEGTIHDAKQANIVIETLTKELAKQDTTEIRKKLAEAYTVLEDYANVITQYNKVLELTGTSDPFIEKAIEVAYCSQIDQAITELSNNPQSYENPEQQIADFTAQKNQYRLEQAEKRARNFPNDAQLRYDLGILYFDNGNYDAAITEFQNSAKNPQRRLISLSYLGRCFTEKKQFDIAIEQFNQAIENMSKMDKVKMETLYYLAKAYEGNNNSAEAIKSYKEIYQNQADFMDVAERINSYYAKDNQ